MTNTILFDNIPTMGMWILIYEGNATSNLTFISTDINIQTALRDLPGLDLVEVVGNYTDGFVVSAVDLGTLTSRSCLLSRDSTVTISIEGDK